MFLNQHIEFDPRSTKIEKSDFFFDFVKTIFFLSNFICKKSPQVKTLYIGKSHKNIQTLSVNFEGISDINRKGRQKKGEKEQFSLPFSKLFFNKLYLSHRGYIS